MSLTSALTIFALILPQSIWAQETAQPDDDLREGFEQPPAQARPFVWWHWMNGNITPEGIVRDLQWFEEAGVGGFTAFDGAGSVPRFVDQPLVYMTPEWRSAFRLAMEEAERRNMEASIAASPGWSQTGGPWVAPQQAMKRYVWTETTTNGSMRFSGMLPRPSDHVGTFQDRSVDHGRAPERFYRDARVFAYRVPQSALLAQPMLPTITTPSAWTAANEALGSGLSPVALDSAALSNGLVTDPVYLAPATADSPAQVDITYPAPVTLRGLTIANGANFAAGWRPEFGPVIHIEAENDDGNFVLVAEGLYAGAQRTFAFPATTARAFRVRIFPHTSPIVPRPAPLPQTPTAPGAIVGPATPLDHNRFNPFGRPVARSGTPGGFALSELVMRAAPPVEQFEVKAGFGVVNDYYAIPTIETGIAVAPADVIDLTGQMTVDGGLEWDVPEGEWVIVRMGYGLTGKVNGPASAEATGLEVDKLNPEHVRAYLDTYLDSYEEAVGPDLIGPQGLRAILNDSYEAGFQNWTENILEQFRQRRGYDPAPWLPVLTGVAVSSGQDSDRFLWDWRRTIFDLLADSHYRVIAEEAHDRGLIAYAEALEDNRAYHGDDIDMRRFADVPMSAIGVGSGGASEGTIAPARRYVDSRGAASVAHVYGRDIAAAEAFTALPADRSPREAKTLADALFLHGINRIFVHTSAHQPGDTGPGVTLNNIGFFFTRNEPWAGMARSWTDYLARTSYLLQQGDYVADYAWFYGEEAPITGIWGGDPGMEIPTGRGFDFINADGLLNHLSVNADGNLSTPSGMNYRLIYVSGRTQWMTLPVVRRLREMVEAGASIAGERPIGSPSLADDPATFEREADALWGSGTPGVRIVGRGRVYTGFDPDDALERQGVEPDVSYLTEAGDQAFEAIHRRAGDADIYYVVNRRGREYSYDLTFRVTGKDVEFWDPVTGEIRPADYRTVDGRTVVPITLNGAGSVFVVMRGTGTGSRSAPTPRIADTQVLDGRWQIHFQPGRGAPASLILDGLVPLNESPIEGVRYFSGETSYSRTFSLIDLPGPTDRLMLDLGEVQDMARVYVNDREVGTVWRPPFAVDVTDAVHQGENTLRVLVANTWHNRLVGDQQPGMAQVTFAPSATIPTDTPLAPSGLIGPVYLKVLR